MALTQTEPLQLSAIQNHTLSTAQIKAARLVAEGELTEPEIGKKVHRARPTIAEWKRIPEFKSLVEQYRAEIDAAILEGCRFARKVRRVQALDAMALDNLRALQENGYEVEETLYTRMGDHIATEKKFDAQRYNAVLKTLADIASELGERKTPSGRMGVEIEDAQGRAVRFVVEMGE